MCSLLSEIYPSGESNRFVPAATATLEVPWRRTCTAWCTAIRLLEHAVSIVIHGPVQLKKYDSRAEAFEFAIPVELYVLTTFMSWAART
jgi:hypothetical protein